VLDLRELGRCLIFENRLSRETRCDECYRSLFISMSPILSRYLVS